MTPEPINLTQMRDRIRRWTSLTHTTAGELTISVRVPTLLALIDTAETAIRIHDGWETGHFDMNDLSDSISRYER